MNFLVIINTKDYIKSISLNEMMYDGKYYYIYGDCLNMNKNLYLPIYKDNDIWKIKSIDLPDNFMLSEYNKYPKSSTNSSSRVKYSDYSLAAYYDDNLVDKNIEDGDYIKVKTLKTGFDYNILFREVSKVEQSTKIYRILKNTEIVFGNADNCGIVFDDKHKLISANHFKFIVNNNRLCIKRIDKNLIYVNGKSVSEKVLEYGDVIELYDYKLIYLNYYLGIIGSNYKVDNNLFGPADLLKFSKDVNKTSGNAIEYEKKPRIIPNYDRSEIQLQLPPEEIKTKKTPAILAIGPSLTMSLGSIVTLVVTINNFVNGGSKSTLYTTGALTISMLLGAILWPILNRNYQAKQEKKANEERIREYSEYISEMTDTIQTKNNSNLNILNELYLSPVSISKKINSLEINKLSLFERQIGDGDFLRVRIGNGTVPTDLNLSIPAKEFEIKKDKLKEEIYGVYDSLKEMSNAPICVSLIDNPIIGITGDENNKKRIVQEIIMSLTYSHSYDDVKTGFIFNSSLSNEYDWCYSLKSSSNDSQNVRYICTNLEEVHNLSLEIKEGIDARIEEDKDGATNKPYYVFFVFSSNLINEDAFFKKIINSKYVGVSLIYVVEDSSKLPNKCNTIIESNDNENYYYHRDQIKGYTRKFELDDINESIFKNYVDFISRVNIKLEQEIYNVPEKISFLEMYKVGNVKDLNITQRWNENRSFKNIKALIGIKTGGENVYLDMHEQYHGPHGLAAGMTGSGKSEFLQTLILSLALNYSPEEVNFILIDFKGGGMANLFNGMPHLVGKMTNLSGSELNRSMISIESVINDRQKLFKQFSTSDYQINHIDKYQKLYRQNKDKMKPMPHLIIIADEFAQLKSQHPEFMNKLIDIAQIGRSLGIHLLLATQKPAGLVSDQIWSNSKFKVCLKVLDKQDSMGMIKKPDAALIKQAGRCYLQVGYDEIYEYFQSGYSGTPYEESDKFIEEELYQGELIDNTGARLNLKVKDNLHKSKNKDYTQLRALVDYMNSIGKSLGYEEKAIWLPPIAKVIGINELTDNYDNEVFDGTNWVDNPGLKSIICLVDDLKNLRQIPLEIDLSKNIGIVGSQGSGKSIFLQSLIYDTCTRYNPDYVNIDIFDFASRQLNCFNGMPHVNNIVFQEDYNAVNEVLNNYQNEINERKTAFSKYGVASLEEYNNEAEYKLPYKVLIIHNYTAFYEDYLGSQDKLIRIIREANSYGISVVITGINRAAFSKTLDLLKQKYVLNLNDKSYFDYIKKVGSMVPEGYPGRGLVEINGEALEFQVALINKIEGTSNRTEYIKQVIKAMNNSCNQITVKKQAKEEIEEDSKKNTHLNIGKISGKNYYLDYLSFNTLVMVSNDEKGLIKYNNIIDKIARRDNVVIYQVDLYNNITNNSDSIINYKANEIDKMIKDIRSTKNKFIYINIIGFNKLVKLDDDVLPQETYEKLVDLIKYNNEVNLLLWYIDDRYVINFKSLFMNRKYIAIIDNGKITGQLIFDNTLPIEPINHKDEGKSNYLLINNVYKLINLDDLSKRN